MVSETKDTVISNYVFEGIAEKADFNTAEVKNSSEELCQKVCRSGNNESEIGEVCGKFKWVTKCELTFRYRMSDYCFGDCQ